jgi:hypothetical protein
MVVSLRLRRPERRWCGDVCLTGRRRFLDGEPAAFPLAGRFAAGGVNSGRDLEGE